VTQTASRRGNARPLRRPPPRRSRRPFFVGLVLLAIVVAGAAGGVYAWSGATLSSDDSALARVDLQPFAGSIARVTASDPVGRPIPLDVRSGRLTPTTPLAPGEQVSISVVVRRPGWSSWALGKTRHVALSVRAPVAHVRQRWLTVQRGAPVRVGFDTSVSRVSVGGRPVASDGASVSLRAKAAAGTVEVAAAARTWELVGPAVKVTWFPPARQPVVLTRPAPSARISPLEPLRLTFSKPVSAVLGSSRPAFSPKVPGRWAEADSHTLVFTPSHFGARFASTLHARFSRAVAVAGAGDGGASVAREIDWHVAPASFLRLQQLLAQEGYLPVTWTPSATPIAHSARAELAAAIDAPDGTFSWRYPNTPIELRQLWREGEPNTITRGAVMMFQHDHDLAVDGIAGKDVWQAVLADTLAGKRRTDGYSYVFVHRSVPQLLTLWHNGTVVLTSPGNTGVPAAPTALGTFPVFEHIPVGRMSGTNPDGSHYDDPGIRWISYFHEGEALHAFNRNSFGTPQSLGCVELPLASAAKVWPYTPIGTLVTIEN
jgi:lipoprotein-anchoring transpeptidase ErfK/SrfK